MSSDFMIATFNGIEATDLSSLLEQFEQVQSVQSPSETHTDSVEPHCQHGSYLVCDSQASYSSKVSLSSDPHTTGCIEPASYGNTTTEPICLSVSDTKPVPDGDVSTVINSCPRLAAWLTGEDPCKLSSVVPVTEITSNVAEVTNSNLNQTMTTLTESWSGYQSVLSREPQQHESLFSKLSKQENVDKLGNIIDVNKKTEVVFFDQKNESVGVVGPISANVAGNATAPLNISTDMGLSNTMSCSEDSPIMPPSSLTDYTDSSASDDDIKTFASPPRGCEYHVGGGVPVGISGTRLFGPHRQQVRRRPAKEIHEDTEMYYDKLPSYYTVFSMPANRIASAATETKATAVTSSEMDSSDWLRCDYEPLPAAGNSPPQFNKLPSYYSCFANSTKYDVYDTTTSGFQPCAGSGWGGESRERAHSPKYSVDLGRLRSRSHRRPRPQCSPICEASLSGGEVGSGKAATVWREFIRSPTGRKRCSTRVDRKSRKEHLVESKEISEMRRILYIGRISDNYTSDRLRQQFGQFGEIEKCSVHFRDTGDNYAFVTYRSTDSAVQAMESRQELHKIFVSFMMNKWKQYGGTQLPGCEHFDICFGGRRNFCPMEYSDLDGKHKFVGDLAIQSLSSSYEYNVSEHGGISSSTTGKQCDYQQLLLNAQRRAANKEFIDSAQTDDFDPS